MRAATLQGARIEIRSVPDPVPAPGQLLVRPIFTGICGSDLSLRKQMAAAEQDAGPAASELPVIVPGHEFSAEVLEVARESETALKPGDLITALPFTHDQDGPQTIGLAPQWPGGLAELSCVDACRSFAVPDGLPPDLAALAEPLAVGLHAANLASRNRGPNLVIGCGPVGLAVILSLRLQGRGPVIAADLSAERRSVAEALGADLVLDPAEESPLEAWARIGFTPQPMSPLLPRTFSGLPPGANVFECTGAPGMIDRVMQAAPAHTQIIIVGVCPHAETVTPLEGIVRELTLAFSFAYRPAEFADALAMLAANPEAAARLITSRRPLEETAAAFDALAKKPSEIKVLIEPGR